MPQFQLNSKSLFVTYPQATPLEKNDVLAFYVRLGCRYVLVAQEYHDDGGKHFHVYCEFDNSFRSRDQRALDIRGFHPNIQSPRNKQQVCDYCKKDGDYIEHGVSVASKKGWGALIDESRNESGFLQLVRENYPRDFVLQHERLEYFARKYFERSVVEYEPNFLEFDIPDNLADWVLNEFPKQGRLVIARSEHQSVLSYYPCVISDRQYVSIRLSRVPSTPRCLQLQTASAVLRLTPGPRAGQASRPWPSILSTYLTLIGGICSSYLLLGG